ncbi:hypothetical protein BCR32DRAFT_238148 [Anaeromyces robustus]|uniref:CBM10 domain-containing protein n=1 Tax=Anaeromyces robustus TaxID=1754192 RepID=A0A1Y1W0D6_9FUNG|nr:hypothetical protein BCR32DRAFT_238148 [Anaeromyces robustus]|eukprot:ORX66977.1 hypothetical protein BCR32DRAFT_238148 [Anaeromyces robustus]
MMEKSIPEMHVIMSDSEWNKMYYKAQITSQNQNTNFDVEAQLIFTYNGKNETYNIDFELGGKSSTEYTKPGYNIKIKSGETLHGTKNFRLRSDQRDATMMRSKISTDILQRSGLISVEVGYTELYINNEYRGFWVVSDSIKNKWIKRKFGDVDGDITNLIQCKEDNIRFDDYTAKIKCINTNNEYVDNMKDFNKFVDQVNVAKSRADLEKIMEVDNFIKYMAWEWLVGTWDHFLGLYGHNLYWYQQPNGKWVYIPYDHDLDIGQDLWTGFFLGKSFSNYKDINFANLTFKDFELSHPIIKILILNDDTFFRECVGDIISKVFNPDTLLAHIDDIKNLISPYVKKDKASNSGKINEVGKDVDYTYEHFLKNIEYTYLSSSKGSTRGYGLKDWIRRRYQFAAAYYGIDKNHKLINPRPISIIYSYMFSQPLEWKGSYPNVQEAYIESQLPDYIPNLAYSDDSIPTIGVNTNAIFSPSSISSSSLPSSSSCWAQNQGYQCCTSCDIVYEDNDGSWGIENGDWCGINTSCFSEEADNGCFSINFGFPCCSSCVYYYEDDDGKWGVENNNWCGIKNSCQNKIE